MCFSFGRNALRRDPVGYSTLAANAPLVGSSLRHRERETTVSDEPIIIHGFSSMDLSWYRAPDSWAEGGSRGVLVYWGRRLLDFDPTRKEGLLANDIL